MQIRAVDRSLFYARKDANEHDAGVWTDVGSLSMADVLLEPRWYLPFSDESFFAVPWAYWRTNNPRGEEPPAAPKRQIELYRQLQTTADPDEQLDIVKEILSIAADEFYAIGIILPTQAYGVVRNDFGNVPSSMPNAWLYPHPGPTNPEQYFRVGASGSTSR